MMMRKYRYLFLALVAAVVLPLGFAACSNNDNPIVPPVDEPVNPMGRDAVRFFLHAICTCDPNGENFENFHWGKELYPETDPGHLYIGVDTWEEAERMFRRYWLAPNVKPALIAPSEMALKAPLLDRQGTEQMQVFLKPGETDDVVAELTLSDESQMKHFYKITFLKNSAWPEEQGARTRASKKYKWRVGDVLKNVTITSENEVEEKLDDEDKTLDFVCIRSASNGVNPWFATVTKHAEYKYGKSWVRPTYNRIRHTYYVPDKDTAEEIDSIMHENWDLIKNAWNDADNGAFPNNDDNCPFIDSCHDGTWHCAHTYNFDSGETGEKRAPNGAAPFFLQFDMYEDDEVEDEMTVWRNKREDVTSEYGSSCSQCD